jgi:hypothetical protein
MLWVVSSYSSRKADECIYYSAVVQNSGQKQASFVINLEIKAVSNACTLDKITTIPNGRPPLVGIVPTFCG